MNYSRNWILVSIFCSLIFCVSFVYFFTKIERKKYTPKNDIENTLEKDLPKMSLLLSDFEEIPDNNLRKGHVILVFFSPTCDACRTEAKFLEGVIDKRADVNFYGITSNITPSTSRLIEQQFPFRILIDREMLLTFSLGIKSVPFKVYLKDGIVKKFWRGATVNESEQKEFIDWLENL
jgi:peroxiredoxin